MAKVMGAGKYTLPTMRPKEGLWPSLASVGKGNILPSVEWRFGGGDYI